MSNQKARPRVTLITPEFAAFGVNLAQARKPEGFPTAKAKFGLSIPLTQEEVGPIVAQLKALAKECFPNMDDQGRVTRSNGDSVKVKLPFDAGDDINRKRQSAGKSVYDRIAGKIVLKASSDEAYQPAVCDLGGMPVPPGSVKSGDILRAQVSFVGNDIPGGFIGISCYLNSVLLVKKTNTRSAADAFGSFINKSEINPTTWSDEAAF